MKKSLENLMQCIDETYTFDGSTYPELKGASDDECFGFGINHSALHMVKSAAVVSAEAEKADHGGIVDHDNLEIAATKQLINALKLAAELGMDADTVVDKVNKTLKIHNS